ncbi:MAG TPA: hypothetical protein VK589_17275 [Chryseolinea sp.]|nr:hypothetical protein [Chryseolinea sp.]
MKYIFTTFACVLALNCVAQHHFHKKDSRTYNFSQVDPSTIDKEELRKKLETAKIKSGYDSLQALTEYVHMTDDNQFATLAFGYQHAFGSLSNLQRELAPLGFNNINENTSNFLISLDMYKNRVMVSFIAAPGFRNLSTNEDLELRIRRSAIQTGIGYDLIKNKHIDLFPQVTIGFQDFHLDVTQKDVNVNTIPDLVDEMVNTSMRKRTFIFTYGGEFDYKIYTATRARIILGVRYAQVVEAGDGKYRINKASSDFKLDDTIAKSTLSFVVKMIPGARR